MNWKNIKEGIGWSKDAWCKPLRAFVEDNQNIKFNHYVAPYAQRDIPKKGSHFWIHLVRT